MKVLLGADENKWAKIDSFQKPEKKTSSKLENLKQLTD